MTSGNLGLAHVVELKARSQVSITTKVTSHDWSSCQVMVTNHIALEEQIKGKDNRQNSSYK